MVSKTEICFFTVMQVGSLRSKCAKGWFLPRAVKENLFVASLAPGCLLMLFSFPWLLLHLPDFCLHLHIFSLCTCPNPSPPPFFFFQLHMQHIEVPRLGVESELQLLAYTTVTAAPDPSHICCLHLSSQPTPDP